MASSPALVAAAAAIPKRSPSIRNKLPTSTAAVNSTLEESGTAPNSHRRSFLFHSSAKLPTSTAAVNSTLEESGTAANSHRRSFLFHSSAAIAVAGVVQPPAWADSGEEYVKETEEMINRVRVTISLEKNDPVVADAVAQLREASNSWVAKYRREKNLLGRTSFRDMYSVLNAVSGHYISFGPTAPIPAKRKQRILDEMDTAEKALLRGR